MIKQTLEEAVKIAKSYYINNNLSIPNSVVEYIKDFPKGMSRQMVQSRYGIKCSEFVKLLNPTYEKPMCAGDRAVVESSRLNYKLITDPATLHTNRDVVTLECIDCGYIHNTTITSMSGTKLGCPKCKSGNLPWYKREQELDNILVTNFNSIRVSDIPSSEVGYLTVVHKNCGSEYRSQLLGFINPNTKNRGTCPNCRDSDRRVTTEGITFGSQFEHDCYQLIKKFNPELHIKYKDYLPTERRWVCDFKIGNFWIEVSNFKVDYKDYFKNIQDKEKLVEDNGYHFFFITSLKEMEEISSLI